ncbi:MAG: phage portal protein [Alphaproteobacteria bacterium]|nr:phage portal protein [Alphaproteobacteria bacterium]
MNIFSAIGRIFAPKQNRASAGVPSYGMIPPLGSVPSASGLMISQATAMAVSAVYACVAIRAKDVARCTPRLFVPNKDGGRDLVKDHIVAKLFARPNRQQTWFEFWQQMMIGYLLRGNAYAAILRDRRGNPVELIPINPDAVMVLEAADGSIFYNVNRIGLWQIAMLRDMPVAVPEEDMFHLRGISFNTLVGVSTIGLARDAIGLAMGLEQQASRWVGNGARPSGVLKAKTRLSEQAALRLKQQWQAFTGGLQNVGQTAVLEEGVEWQAVQLTSVDLEFIQQRNLQIADIARYYDVPLSRLGVVGSASSKITPAEEEQAYVNHTVMPDLVIAEQKFEQVFGLDKEGIEVDFDEGQLLRADIMTRYNAARLGVLTGILTPNEVRRSEGLPPVDGGDKLMVPANTAALGSDMTGTAPDGAGRPESGNLPKPGVPTSGDPDPQLDPQGEL